MPHAKLAYTFVVKGKHWYFRRGSLQVALPGSPETSEFHRKYGELLALSQKSEPSTPHGSFEWLIGRYLRGVEFKALKPATQQDYERVLKLIGNELGKQPFAQTTTRMIKAVRDDHAGTSRKAHKIKQMVSRLYTWAQEEGLVEAGFNPAASIRRLKVRPKSYVPWSDDEISLFLEHCPTSLRTPILLALYTGQRREDLVKLSWDSYHGRFIRLVQSKTGVPLDIACHPELRKHLASVKTSFGGPIARTAKGRPFTVNGLSQAIRRVVKGIPGFPPNRSLHGLRYAAAARLNEAGCPVDEVVAVLGHRTYGMAIKYMAQRSASEAALARQELRR